MLLAINGGNTNVAFALFALEVAKAKGRNRAVAYATTMSAVHQQRLEQQHASAQRGVVAQTGAQRLDQPAAGQQWVQISGSHILQHSQNNAGQNGAADGIDAA